MLTQVKICHTLYKSKSDLTEFPDFFFLCILYLILRKVNIWKLFHIQKVGKESTHIQSTWKCNWFMHLYKSLQIFCRLHLQTNKKNWVSLLYEEFEDTKEVIRIRILKKNRQHNMAKWITTKGRPIKHTHRTKDRVSCTPLKTGV
jgi:hypothetical protein